MTLIPVFLNARATYRSHKLQRRHNDNLNSRCAYVRKSEVVGPARQLARYSRKLDKGGAELWGSAFPLTRRVTFTFVEPAELLTFDSYQADDGATHAFCSPFSFLSHVLLVEYDNTAVKRR